MATAGGLAFPSELGAAVASLAAFCVVGVATGTSTAGWTVLAVALADWPYLVFKLSLIHI